MLEIKADIKPSSVKTNVKDSDKTSMWSSMKKGYNPMEEGVRWTEKYADQLEVIWRKMPRFLRNFMMVFCVLLLGSALKGEWILIMFHLLRQFGFISPAAYEELEDKYQTKNNGTEEGFFDNFSAEKFSLQGWIYHMIGTCVVSYGLYFGLGGFIHWYFYIRQRKSPEEWKCQPEKFMSPDLERHEIIFGSLSLMCSCSVTATISCYAFNDGSRLTLYYDLLEYGWLWLILQIPVIFIYQDYTTYWIHRISHTPFLYKHFHKMHHKYKQPTVFSVTAIHPMEIVFIQLMLMIPIITFPCHWFMFYGIAVYTYYHGIIDHSGVNFKAFWWQPWQPDAIFHDNHHQYFHVNFGFNIFIWDKLHGTYRRKDRVYNEDFFYGQGKAFDEVPESVLKDDIAERKSENPLAYKSNKNEFEVSESEVKKQL